MIQDNLFTVVAGDGSSQTRCRPMDLLPWCPAHHLEVFDALNLCLPFAGIHFVLTWDLTQQPFVGKNTVIMLLGDERGQVPLSANKVLAIFRNGTTQQEYPSAPWRAGYSQWLLQWFRLTRNIFKKFLRALKPDGSWKTPSNVFPIPIGTMSPEPVDIIPLSKRTFDISLFASVGRRWSLGPFQIPLQPKTLARYQAIKAINKLARDSPELITISGCSDDPRWGEHVSAENYLHVLSNTRIAPCPRGNFSETFRHHEAARAGCVIISEPVPNEWYFANHPFIIIQNWSDLTQVVKFLKDTPAEMERLSLDSLSWWKTTTSPEAVAKYITSKLSALKPELVGPSSSRPAVSGFITDCLIPTDSKPLISAVVPACERIAPLLKTLSKIHNCIPQPDEIIVHVDGANAAVMEAVRQNFPDIQLLSSPSLQGPGGARNKLINAAKHEWVANFDDDSFPQDADYFAKVQELASLFPEAAILSAANHDDHPTKSRFTRISAASGCGCVFHKSWYHKVGGFVPLPIAYNMEEVDMGLRLHALGGMIVRDAELIVIHDKPYASEISAYMNACILANTALLPLLRFPIWLWPVGVWQVTHRFVHLIARGWTQGIGQGLRMIPTHFQSHIQWRAKVNSSSILSWLVLRRFPKAIAPTSTVITKPGVTNDRT